MGEKKTTFKDLTGEKFGKLNVIKFSHKEGKNKYYWICNCECGNENLVINGKYLRSGETKSCGCLRKENVSRINATITNRNYYNNVPTDSLFRNKLLNVWKSMYHRCYNKNDKHYKWYGAKGVSICNEWLDIKDGFYNFYHWSINNGYQEGLSIDRIDVCEPYEPNNCEWTTHKEQCNNMSSNILITYKNKTLTASQWEEELNHSIDAETIRRRWNEGVRGKKLFEIVEMLQDQLIEIDGEIKTALEWVIIAGITMNVFRSRINRGITGKDLIKPIDTSKRKNGKNYTNIITANIDGKTLTLKQVSEIYKIHIDTVRHRYKQGLRDEELIKKKRKVS